MTLAARGRPRSLSRRAVRRRAPLGRTLQLADLGAEHRSRSAGPDSSIAADVGRYVACRSRRARTRSSSRRSTATSAASRSISGIRRRAACSRTSCASCDAVYSNLRGDQPRKLGLTYEQLKGVNPAIVCCSLSGFGMTGPRAAEGGYDYMMQGLAGWQSLTGEPGGPPTKSGLSLVDLSGGYASAIAMLAGIWRARRDGVGCDCDVSLFETALHELMYIGPWAATHGYVPPRRPNSAHPTIVPFQNFEAVGRLVRRRRCQAGVLGAAVRRDRAARPERGRALRHDGGPQRRTATSCCRSSRSAFRARTADEWIEALVVGRRARGAGQHRRGGARRPADDRPRATSSSTSTRPSGGCARSARRCGSRTEPSGSSSAGARAASRRAHRRRCSSSCAGTRRSGWASSPRQACSGSRGDRPRLRRLRAAAARPTLAGRGAHSRSASSSTTRRAASGRRSRAMPASEAFLHEVVGAPPTVGAAQPQHRVDVRVRQPRRLLARASHLHRRTACR